MSIINKPAQELFLEPIKGKWVPKIADYKGQVLLILFYYLGCPGCKGRAIPYANRLKVELGDKLNVIGIHSNFNASEYTDDEIINQMDELYARFPYYRDAGIATTFHDYEAAGTPHWVLIDADGMVVESMFGSEPNKALLRLDYKLQEVFDANK